jgi:hypothetical protein
MGKDKPRPKHDPDEVKRKQERAGKSDDNVKNPIAKGETVSELRAREEANRKKTIRDYE